MRARKISELKHWLMHLKNLFISCPLHVKWNDSSLCHFNLTYSLWKKFQVWENENQILCWSCLSQFSLMQWHTSGVTAVLDRPDNSDDLRPIENLSFSQKRKWETGKLKAVIKAANNSEAASWSAPCGTQWSHLW